MNDLTEIDKLAEARGDMLQARQIAMVDGKPMYKDHSGKLCVETNGFQYLRGLTSEEKSKLLKTLNEASLVEMGGW